MATIIVGWTNGRGLLPVEAGDDAEQFTRDIESHVQRIRQGEQVGLRPAMLVAQCEDHGKEIAGVLQPYLTDNDPTVRYFAFDLLRCSPEKERSLPLVLEALRDPTLNQVAWQALRWEVNWDSLTHDTRTEALATMTRVLRSAALDLTEERQAGTLWLARSVGVGVCVLADLRKEDALDDLRSISSEMDKCPAEVRRFMDRDIARALAKLGDQKGIDTLRTELQQGRTGSPRDLVNILKDIEYSRRRELIDLIGPLLWDDRMEVRGNVRSGGCLAYGNTVASQAAGALWVLVKSTGDLRPGDVESWQQYNTEGTCAVDKWREWWTHSSWAGVGPGASSESPDAPQNPIPVRHDRVDYGDPAGAARSGRTTTPQDSSTGGQWSSFAYFCVGLAGAVIVAAHYLSRNRKQ